MGVSKKIVPRISLELLFQFLSRYPRVQRYRSCTKGQGGMAAKWMPAQPFFGSSIRRDCMQLFVSLPLLQPLSENELKKKLKK